MNTKVIAFIAGASVGALSAFTGFLVTAKIFSTTAEEDERAANEEQEYFTNAVHNYLKIHDLEDAEIEEHIHVIEDVCTNFDADYRKFLVSLYDFIAKDEYDQLITYLTSIQIILKSYSSARWMDTNQAIKSIINGNTIVNETDAETVESENV